MATKYGRLLSAAGLDRIVEIRIRGRRQNFSFLVPLAGDLSGRGVGEIFVVRSCELDCDHARSKPENRILFKVRPVLCISHRREERVWVVGVIERRLDALGVVCGWYRWVVVPLRSKRFPYRVGGLDVHFHESLFQIPSEFIIRVSILEPFLFLHSRRGLSLGCLALLVLGIDAGLGSPLP